MKKDIRNVNGEESNSKVQKLSQSAIEKVHFKADKKTNNFKIIFTQFDSRVNK